jgi:hypothetical protein
MDLSLPRSPVPAVPAAGNDIDRKIRSELGRATGSLSVGSAMLAAGDWGVNLMVSPGKQMELGLLALEYAGQLARHDVECWLAGPGETRRQVQPPTVTDHVAPWRSVYKLHYMTGAEITFALTSGGHNAGVVSPPGTPRRHYQLLKSAAGTPRLDPDHWLAEAPDHQGSWWPAWRGWLRAHSGDPVKPPRMGLPGERPVDDAPGRYVLEK